MRSPLAASPRPRYGNTRPLSQKLNLPNIILSSTPRRRKPTPLNSPAAKPHPLSPSPLSPMRDLEESSRIRKARRRMLEKALISLPEQGCGRVMYLVKTFERLLSMSKEETATEEEDDEEEESKSKVVKWALPGLLLDYRPEAEATEFSYSFDFPSSSDEEDEILSRRSSKKRLCW